MSLPFLTGRTLNLNESKMELILNPNQMTPEKMAAWGRAFPEARTKALNKTAQRAKTHAGRLVKERYVIKKRDIDKSIRIIRASVGKDEASLRVSGKKVGMSYFNVTGGRGSSVEVEIVKGQRKVIPPAFIATMPSGHKGVFLRGVINRNPVKRRKAVPRREIRANIWGSTELPIDELTGPSLPQMFGQTKVQEKLIDFVNAVMPKNLTSAINFFQR